MIDEDDYDYEYGGYWTNKTVNIHKIPPKKQEARDILSRLNDDDELMQEFNLLLRSQKLNKIKGNVKT